MNLTKLDQTMKKITGAVCSVILMLTMNDAYSKPSIEKYDLKFNFDFKELKLFCKAELSLNHVAQNDSLDLLLYRLLKVVSIKDESGNAIRFNQQITSFSDWEALQVNHITVFAGEINPTQLKQKIIIQYEGLLLGYTETGMNYVKDNIDPNFTLLRMDCFAYPVQGVTSWEKNRMAGLSYFDYSVSLTVPDSISVVNGGKLVSKIKSRSYTEFIYHNIKPAWRIDIAIGKYSTLNEHGFSIYYFPADSVGARVVSAAVKDTYRLFSDWFGDIPFSGYSIIEIPDDWGSQTDVTCIIQTASAFTDKNRLYELYHEMSHIWNVRSTDKYPCRLESEGLAMFLQSLVMEKFEHKTGILDSAATRIFSRLQKKFLSDSLASNTAITNYGLNQMTDLSYTKGMLFFYLLYKGAGETAFMKTLNGFCRLYRDKGATIEDFSNYLKSALKTRQTEKLINEWIFTSISSQHILKSKSIENLLQ